MTYVDGFVLPLPKDNIDAYQKMAEDAGKIWMEHGALEYKECIGEDVDSAKFGLSFPEAFGLKNGEIPVFSYIVYKSRAHRDEVNAKVMADPRMQPENMPKKMPFDCNRMAYGGFKVVVGY